MAGDAGSPTNSREPTPHNIPTHQPLHALEIEGGGLLAFRIVGATSPSKL